MIRVLIISLLFCVNIQAQFSLGVWNYTVETTAIPTDYISYWDFQGDADDQGIANNDGTVVGATLTNDRNGNANSAYSFDGNDYISLSSYTYFDSTFSISFWINLDPGNYSSLFPVVIQLETEFSNGLLFYLTESLDYTGIGWGSSTASTGRFRADSGSFFEDVWRHVVITYDNISPTLIGSYECVINDTVKTIGNTYGLTTVPNANRIGARTSGDLFFTGKIDDIRIYKRVLTAAEITALYNE